MSVRQSPVYRGLMIVLSIAFLGGAGFLGWWVFVRPSGGAAQSLAKAEEAYTKGVQAYTGKDFKTAFTRFDEARLLSEKAADELNAENASGKSSVPQDQITKTSAKILYLLAKAQRDGAYAKAADAGTPLPEIPDASTGETFRSVFAVRDDQNTRQVASSNILRAARDDQTDPELVKDAIRIEASEPALRWAYLEPLCRAAVKMNDKDNRALFFLARYEFEQPIGSGGPSPDDKKDRTRVAQAREFLKRAKDAGTPYWRATLLDAKILRWQAADAARRQKPADDARLALKAALFEPGDGALAKAARGEKFTPLNPADLEGILGVFQIAAEAATEAGGSAADPANALAVARGAVQAATALGDSPQVTKPMLGTIAEQTARTVAVCQPAAAKSFASEWAAVADGLKAFLAKHPDAAKTNPAALLLTAGTARADAAAAFNRGDRAAAEKLIADARGRFEEGLKLAAEAKLPTDEFRANLAYMDVFGGGKADAAEAHLKPLRSSADPRARATAQYLDGVQAARLGKLDSASKLLAPLVGAGKEAAHVSLPASATLASVYLQMNKPTDAIRILREVEQAYDRLDLTDKQGVTAEFPTFDAVLAAEVFANLGAAVEVYAKAAKDTPGQPPPPERTATFERAAGELLKRLRAPSPADKASRLAFVSYLAMTGRKDQAKQQIVTLGTDYPDDAAVVRADAAMRVPADLPKDATPAQRYAAADARIQEFVGKYGADAKAGRSAKLLWAEWLARTGRGAEAADFLKNPANFPGGKDPVVERLLAGALFQAGKRGESKQVLAAMPRDAAVSADLIRMAGSAAERRSELSAALEKYQDTGLFRLYDATTKLADGKYEEAVRAYAAATEFTRVAAAARAGMLNALVSYAAADPAKGRELAVRVAADRPADPEPYLAAAAAALQMEDVGEARDQWETAKTMHAALNRWERLAADAKVDRATIAYTKAQFYLDAGDVPAARGEATRSATQNPEHAPTQVLLARLALEFPDGTNAVARAEEHIKALAKADPDNAQLPWIEAQLRELAGKPAEAVAVYEKQLALNPKNPLAYARLVAVSEKAGKPDDAVRWATKWQAELPDDGSATLEMVRLLAAGGSLPAAKAMADEFVTKAVEKGKKAATDSGAAADAVAQTTDAVRRAATFYVANAFFRANAFAEATARADALFQLKPDAEEALMLIGNIAIGNKQWDRAIEVYRKVVDKAAADGVTRNQFVAGNNLAWVLATHKNDPRAAVEVVDRVRKGKAGKPIAADRLPTDFLDTIGVVYNKLNDKQRFTEMRDLFEAAAKRHPTDPRMFVFLADAQAALGETSRATATYDAAIKLATDPQNTRVTDPQKKDALQAAEAGKKKLRS